MKVFCNTLICDLKRTFISLYFLTATIGLAFVKIITLFDEAPSFIPGETTIVYIDFIEQNLGFNNIYLEQKACRQILTWDETEVGNRSGDNGGIRYSYLR